MPMQPIRYFYDFLNQTSRALYIFLETSKIQFEAVPISILRGEHLTGEYRDKVTRFKKVPAITDHGFQLTESIAIFRHLIRENIVPEFWYPRKNLGRSRIDEYLEWRQRHLGLVTTNYFQQKWLLPMLHKTQPNENTIDLTEKQLNGTLNDFENLFLKSKPFMISDTVSYADLMAICEIDQSKYIGFKPFTHRPKLAKWYQLVSEELGSPYKEVTSQFENKLRSAEKGQMEAVTVKQ